MITHKYTSDDSYTKQKKETNFKKWNQPKRITCVLICLLVIFVHFRVAFFSLCIFLFLFFLISLHKSAYTTHNNGIGLASVYDAVRTTNNGLIEGLIAAQTAAFLTTFNGLIT